MKYYFSLLIIIGTIFCCYHTTFAQETPNTFTIAGIVMDDKGEELIGVNIYVKGTSLGVVTDIDGRFRLKNIPKNSVVTFSAIGFENYKLTVTDSKEKLKIGLSPKVDELDQVVVVAHGTQRKVSTTGAITTIAAEDLQVPATSVSNMMQGRVPGIIGVTRSGEPGNDYSEFWIRGISTFGANTGALVLVDGVEGRLDDIDPVDIESFSILKDASATAVYGVRGANGVVIVTTKKGKAGQLKINFKANHTLTQSARMPEYLGAGAYAELANEARVVRGLEPRFSDVEIELFKTGLDPDLYP